MATSLQLLIAATGIFGTVAGATAAAISNYIIQKRTRFEVEALEARVMAISLAAEIQSIVKIGETRKWIDNASYLVTELRGPNANERMRMLKLDAQLKRNLPPFAIYDGYTKNIGKLGPLATDVIEFYTELKLLEGAANSMSSEIFIKEVMPDELANLVEDVFSDLEKALKKAKVTIKSLREFRENPKQ